MRSRWRSRQARVPLGRPRAEARGEAVEELRGQRDLRQEHERLPPLPQGLRDRLEIDFGLARAGHAFEQRRRESARGDARRRDPPAARPLVVVEERRAEVRVEVGRDPLRRQRDGVERAVLDEAVDDAGRASGAARRAPPWRSARRRRRAPPERGRARRSCARAACRWRRRRISAPAVQSTSCARIAMRSTMPRGRASSAPPSR